MMNIVKKVRNIIAFLRFKSFDEKQLFPLNFI